MACLLVTFLLVFTLAAVAADYTCTTTADQDASLARPAAQQGLTLQQYVQQHFAASLPSVTAQSKLEEAVDLLRKLKALPPDKQKDIEDRLEGKK